MRELDLAHDLRLTPEQVYHKTDLSAVPFETTDDLEELERVIGQPRAVDAIRFGSGMKDGGFNIYALGPTGLDKRGLVQRFFESRARKAPTPSDWCYVHNLAQEHRPLAIELSAGQGNAFRKDMEALVQELSATLSAAFESEEYQSRRQTILDSLRDRQSEAFDELQRQARTESMALIRTPGGIVVAPIREGEVLSPEQVEALSEEAQAQLKAKVEELQDDLQRILRQVPMWQRSMREELNELNREMADLAVGALIGELRERYEANPKIVEHLKAVQEDVVRNAEQFLPQPERGSAELMQAMQQPSQEQFLRRYSVNVLIDHTDTEGAPVVYEDNPTYQNLIGRSEHQARMGALVTDFTLIKPGALHRANGGYLIVDADKLLAQPQAWEGLKRALKSRRINIESLGQQLGLISTVSLEPEPIPLYVRVALIGDARLYYLLWQLDPEFADLFKVAADFDGQMPRDAEHQEPYARLIATVAQREALRPFDRSAVARLMDHSARMVGDAERLSARMREIRDLMMEADYWAGEAESEVVTAAEVQRAIEAQIHRVDRLRERVHESILRRITLIDTEGAVVGQINGLSVLGLGNVAFGQPSRITARVTLGKGQVVDIEREVELGGPLHSKGVMILTGFLNGRYAQDKPLSLSASLVFEQSYGGVDGDSASCAELYTLLSVISGVPIKQSLAVTGSVNQKGEVQAIGGVNEKIEGFFEICKARGLTGEQGVLIPVSNVQHLMLRPDVVEAVAEGRFHVYAVAHVDQGIELLTGVPSGAPDDAGHYPEGTINGLVEARLTDMAEKARAYASRRGEGGDALEGPGE
jgi:predicted ATP-dependent protease